jgi:hypothetical protein
MADRRRLVIHRIGSQIARTACGRSIAGLKVEANGATCPDCKPRRGRVARAPGATVRRYRVTMTDEEHAALKRAAVEQGCKVADLIRRIAPVSPRASQ